MTTKIFRNGNSLAVRIPASIKLGPAGTEVEIDERKEGICIRPASRSLKNVLDRFAAFDRGFMKKGRERGREPERSW